MTCCGADRIRSWLAATPSPEPTTRRATPGRVRRTWSPLAAPHVGARNATNDASSPDQLHQPRHRGSRQEQEAERPSRDVGASGFHAQAELSTAPRRPGRFCSEHNAAVRPILQRAQSLCSVPITGSRERGPSQMPIQRRTRGALVDRRPSLGSALSQLPCTHSFRRNGGYTNAWKLRANPVTAGQRVRLCDAIWQERLNSSGWSIELIWRISVAAYTDAVDRRDRRSRRNEQG
jgi:hypothetical protein